MPNLKLIFILRNPIERALSAANMRFSKKLERDINSVSEDELIKFISTTGVIKRGKYLETIKNFNEFFDEDQIHIDFYDCIKTEPEKLIKRIFSHIGVDSEIDITKLPLKKIIHKSKSKKFIPSTRIKNFLEDTFRSDINKLKEKFGNVIAHW